MHDQYYSQRIILLKEYIEDYFGSWKMFLDHYLENVGRKFALKCRFDVCKLLVSLPVF